MSLREKFHSLQNPIGTQPIAWSNDDFHELGGATSLSQCLSEMHEAGYAGTELGHKFPRTSSALRHTLSSHALRLVSGWHSTYLATRAFVDERANFLVHLDLLKACGATVVIAAECSRRVYDQANTPLDFRPDKPSLSAAEWKRVYAGLGQFADLAHSAGLTLVYHHHMGTVVQSEAELENLLAGVPSLHLLYDTGHLSFAGIDPLVVLRRHRSRVAHVHLKNIRPPIVADARSEGWSFARAVRAGVFTVPGDLEGGVDFPAVFTELAAMDYRGWLVVEAEQDPARANPFHYAKLARSFIRSQTGL